MSLPFHVLKHEHRIIEQVLRAMDGACMRLEGGFAVPTKALAEFAEFINSFTDRYHHRKEEQVLFPVLERHGITREGGPLGIIEREHDIERKLVGELRIAISEYKEGDSEARRRFVEAARSFTRMLVGHIETEDSVLFKIGDEILDEEDKAELMQGFKSFEGQIGLRKLKEYEQKAMELEEEWAL